jgi:hypothetical protein
MAAGEHAQNADIRISGRSPLRPLGTFTPQAGMAAGLLVNALLDRYRLEPLEAGRIAPVWLRSADSGAFFQTVQRWTVGVYPRLELSISGAWSERSGRSRPAPAGGAGSPEPVPIETALQVGPLPARMERVEALVVRLAERLVRAPAFNGADPDRIAAPPTGLPQVRPAARAAASELPTLERTYRKSSGPASAGPSSEVRPPDDSYPAAPTLRSQVSPGSAGQHPALSDHEIGRLTDQVVQAIDERIIAQRERFGRS